MELRKLLTRCFLIGATVIAFFLSLHMFRCDYSGLSREIVLATLTGCLFALPSEIVSAIFEIKKAQKRAYSIMNELYWTLGIMLNNCNDIDTLHRHDEVFVTKQKDLYDLLNNCYFLKHKKEFNSILIDIIEIRKIIEEGLRESNKCTYLNKLQDQYRKCQEKCISMKLT